VAGTTTTIVSAPAIPKWKPLWTPLSQQPDLLAYFKGMRNTRLPFVIVNVLRLVNTIGLIALPRAFWLPFYVVTSLPFRLCTCVREMVDLLSDQNTIDSVGVPAAAGFTGTGAVEMMGQETNNPLFEAPPNR
jgi:hypothetical protein